MSLTRFVCFTSEVLAMGGYLPLPPSLQLHGKDLVLGLAGLQVFLLLASIQPISLSWALEATDLVMSSRHSNRHLIYQASWHRISKVCS